MKRLLPLAALLALLGPSADGAIELVYAIKERTYSQSSNAAPSQPEQWRFGAGVSGDDQLSAAAITLPGASQPTPLPGSNGSFDLQTFGSPSQSALDAAYPNGSLSFTVTDAGNEQQIGPFALDGDSYPDAPYFTNFEAFLQNDRSQAFELQWNSFAEAGEDDLVVFQIYDLQSDEELVFEFLDRSATAYTLAGGTLQQGREYELSILFIDVVAGQSDPQTLVGYLSQTNALTAAPPNASVLQLYKWQQRQQTGPDAFAETDYRAFVSAGDGSSSLTAATIATPAGAYPLEEIAPGAFLLSSEFGSKQSLDNAYPTGDYTFQLTENGIAADYGPFSFPDDNYPTSPRFLNFSELASFPANLARSVSWQAPPDGVGLVTLSIIDDSDQIVWSTSAGPAATSAFVPANTLEAGRSYRIVLRFWQPLVTSESPPAELGYLAATYLTAQIQDANQSSGIDLAYIIKQKSFRQQGNLQPTEPERWSFGAGVEGGLDVTAASLVAPDRAVPLSGINGAFEIEDAAFASQEDLDDAFPSGSYQLEVTVDGSSQSLGPFDFSADGYPQAPRIANAEELRNHDHSLPFTLAWDSFPNPDPEDLILLNLYSRSSDQDQIFEFLERDATSYEIPGGTLVEGQQYEIELIFINAVGQLESPQTIAGYIASSRIDVSTVTSDTQLVFYKSRQHVQTSADAVDAQSYRSISRAAGVSNALAFAELITPATSLFLQNNGAGAFVYATDPLDKAQLDSQFPAGDYRFRLIENESFVEYGPYHLPPDEYPAAPTFLDFDELLYLDPSQDQTVSWLAAPSSVQRVSAFAQTLEGQRLWSAELSADATQASIPADTLLPYQTYHLVLQFWAPLAGSPFPDAALGYQSQTRLTVQTAPESADYDLWKQSVFTAEQQADPSISGPNADPDGDGLSNLLEFLARLDPLDRFSSLAFRFETSPHPSLAIEPLPPDAEWVIRFSDDLGEWSLVPVEAYSQSGTSVRVDLSALPPAVFLRLAFPASAP